MKPAVYYNLNELKKLKNDIKSRGETIIHNDFISDNHNEGRLTYGIKNEFPVEKIKKSDDELLLLFYKKEIQYEDLLDFLTVQYLKDHETRWNKLKARFGL